MNANQGAVAGPRRERADLASGIGAGVLGGGLGVLLAPYAGPYGAALVVVGGLLHAWGMTERHREATADRPRWSEALYRLCWAFLAGIAVLVVAGR